MAHPTRPTTKLHWSVSAFVASLILSAVMAQTIDGPVSQWAQTFNSDVWEQITEFGKSEWVLVPTLVLFLLLLGMGRIVKGGRLRSGLKLLRGIMAYLFSIVALPGIAVALLKQIIGRARPEHYPTLGAHHFMPLSGAHDFASMPSGHTVTSFAFVWGICFLWPSWRWPAFAIAVIISLSRIIVGAHYVSDVFVGITFATLCAFGMRYWMAKRRRLFQVRNGKIERRSLAAIKPIFKLRPTRLA